MTQSTRARRVAPIPTPPHPAAPRQLRLAFESTVLQALTSNERADVVAQLSILLLQAAGQAAGDDDGDH
jgi:hypothetical protein